MVMIAYYLAFCLLCCVGLVLMIHRDRSRTEHTERPD